MHDLLGDLLGAKNAGVTYQPEGLDGRFEIDISTLMTMSMEEDNDIDEDEGDDVLDAKDLQLLERW
jgi:hypothetical protein